MIALQTRGNIYSLRKASNIILLIILCWQSIGSTPYYGLNIIPIDEIVLFLKNAFLSKTVFTSVLFTSVFISFHVSREIKENTIALNIINLKSVSHFYVSKIFFAYIIFSILILFNLAFYSLIVVLIHKQPISLFFDFLKSISFPEIALIIVYLTGYSILSIIIAVLLKNPYIVLPVILGTYLFEKLLLLINQVTIKSWVLELLPYAILKNVYTLNYLNINLWYFLKMVYIAIFIFILALLFKRKKFIE